MVDGLSAPLEEFKPREIEILDLMAQGHSNQEIADQLFITKGTVRWYNKIIYSKLGTSRRTEAIALAREMGLIGNGAPSSNNNLSTHLSLPITTGPFIGRDHELADLSELLNEPDIRLVSIVAAGGMGKSRLSLELGHLIQTHYAHGAVFIDLTSLRNPADIAPITLTALGLNATGQQSPQDTLLNYCREKELLLIFDNFEHVLNGVTLLTDILATAPHVQILATSREKLNLIAETVYFLEPVSESGAKLFLELAQMMRPTIELDDDELQEVERIVAVTGGLPLALQLAATWVDMLSIAEIAAEIESNLEFLSADMGDMPERQRSMHAVIDPTWNRLSENEQRAFMWGSVFRGGFTREAFQAVIGASMRTLQSLLHRSLLSSGHGRRYAMHPLLRQFAREKLEASGNLVDAKNTHLETFRAYAENHADRMYDGQHYLQALEALEIEQDNFRAALDWAFQGNHVQHGIAIILANGEFWRVSSRIQEALTYVDQAIQQSDHPKLYYWQATYLDRLGQIDKSIEAAKRLTAYGEAIEDDELLSLGYLRTGYMVSDITSAQALFKKALAHALTTQNQQLIADCHSCLGLVTKPAGTDSDANLYHFEQALNIYKAIGDLHGISRITNNLAIEYQDNPERRQAGKELIEYSLQLKQKIGDRAGEARRLTTLSLLAIEDEELDLALEWLVKSLEICEELGEKDRLSYTLTTMGLLSLIIGDFNQAQRHFTDGIAIEMQIQDYKGIVDLYGLLGQAYLLQKNVADARQSILKGLEIATQKTVMPSIIIISYANLLWYTNELAMCLNIVATLAQLELQTYSGKGKIIDEYLLNPLIYRVQEYVGKEVWEQAVVDAHGRSVQDLFGQIIESLEAE